MSGLDKILEEIQKDALEVAGHHKEEAQRKADAILEEAKNEIQAKKDANLKNAKLECEDILARAKSSCELETRKAILNKKQELISKIIEDTKAELANMPCEKYFEILLKLAKKHASGETAVMKLSKNDLERVTADFEKNLPKEITLSKESANIENGFLLIYDGIDINCSFEALFDDKMEELQDKASSIIFC